MAEIVGHRIIFSLGKVSVFEVRSSFDFDYKSFFDDKIGPSGTYVDTLIIDDLFLLANEVDSGPSQFKGQAALVDHFLKSGTEGLMHFHSTANYLVGKIIFDHR